LIYDFLTIFQQRKTCKQYSPFCVPAKVNKLVGLKNGGRVSPIDLIIFAGTQNGELKFWNISTNLGLFRQAHNKKSVQAATQLYGASSKCFQRMSKTNSLISG
jgi:hypothetical protein